MAVGFGDAEIAGFMEKITHAPGIEGQNGGAGGIVQSKDGVQFVFAHVANGNSHAFLTSLLVRRDALTDGELSHGLLRGACRSDGNFVKRLSGKNMLQRGGRGTRKQPRPCAPPPPPFVLPCTPGPAARRHNDGLAGRLQLQQCTL